MGETSVVTMFSARVLASAGVAGIRPPALPPTPVAVVTPTPAPTLQPIPIPLPATSQIRSSSPVPVTAIVTDATDDDGIVEVEDDEQPDDIEEGLWQAVTSLPADVQMLGY